MKKIYSSEDMLMTGHIKCILELEGISCFVKQQNLSSGMGEIPPIECWPEIWINDDEDYDRAQSVVTSVLSPAQHKSDPWYCSCGEKIDGQFSACWQCGNERL